MNKQILSDFRPDLKIQSKHMNLSRLKRENDKNRDLLEQENNTRERERERKLPVSLSTGRLRKTRMTERRRRSGSLLIAIETADSRTL